ncbi:hypothetical protein OIU84_007267 [Salix udensis]|uniref:serine C-palmitoyltransferase n=1 Tax=Salix udensis TaxID=889485 RepID=A0AAD6NYX7_9ROSI|nr:hypothetical protein OIU84_007267 [Salix udensis]
MVKIPFFLALSTYFSFGLLFVFGQVRDFFRKIFDFFHCSNLQGYAPICSGQEDFIFRRLYNRVQDCFGRPISSAPDVWFDIVHRYSNDNNKTMRRTSKVTRCLNLGSYNYLGFAAADEYCTPRVIETLKRFSPSTCSPRVDGGTTTLHKELEESVANFVGKPAAIVFGMGYATNTATLPVLIGKGGLIVSDSLNHNSIINGARGSGATIRVFQHNSKLNVIVVFSIQNKYFLFLMHWDLVTCVPLSAVSLGGSFEAAYCGHIGNGRRLLSLWRVFIVWKGNSANFRRLLQYARNIRRMFTWTRLIALEQLEKSGKGVCELLGVDTADVDVMMGTFTKSFGSCGGYIAGSKVLSFSTLFCLLRVV